jgi:drug/metabolite transporter (DMT)-like permease
MWIWLTITAALMQSVRTAAHKELTATLSLLAGTYVRSLFGLPLLLVYLASVKWWSGSPWPVLGAPFLFYSAITALTQIGGTAALLSLFRMRNFAVANQLARTDLFFTALLGTWFFGQNLTVLAWFALAVTACGVGVIMTAKDRGDAGIRSLRGVLTEPSVRAGLLVGLMFAVCNLALREATLALPDVSRTMAGAVTVTMVILIQVVVMAVWLGVREPDVHEAIRRNLPLSISVGITSALGSICWFTAFALEAAAHVRTVGQVEVVFNLLIGYFYFRQAISGREAVGLALTLAGIVLLQLAG